MHVRLRIVDREDVERLAADVEQADLAGLAVAGAVERIAGADRVIVVDVLADAGDQAEAMGLGLARREHGHRVERVAVAVDVAAEEGRAAEIAGDAGVERAVGRGAALGRRGGRRFGPASDRPD